jgi:hypothetical protein
VGGEGYPVGSVKISSRSAGFPGIDFINFGKIPPPTTLNLQIIPGIKC